MIINNITLFSLISGINLLVKYHEDNVQYTLCIWSLKFSLKYSHFNKKKRERDREREKHIKRKEFKKNWLNFSEKFQGWHTQKQRKVQEKRGKKNNGTTSNKFVKSTVYLIQLVLLFLIRLLTWSSTYRRCPMCY